MVRFSESGRPSESDVLCLPPLFGRMTFPSLLSRPPVAGQNSDKALLETCAKLMGSKKVRELEEKIVSYAGAARRATSPVSVRLSVTTVRIRACSVHPHPGSYAL